MDTHGESRISKLQAASDQRWKEQEHLNSELQDFTNAVSPPPLERSCHTLAFGAAGTLEAGVAKALFGSFAMPISTGEEYSCTEQEPDTPCPWRIKLLRAHFLCFAVHSILSVMCLLVSADNNMDLEIFRVTQSWNVTNSAAPGLNGFTFKMEPFFKVRVDELTASFFVLSAICHGLWVMAAILSWCSQPWLLNALTRCIARCFCWWRFAEYSLSASLMLVLIAVITLTREYNALLAIFALTFTTMMFGLVTELASKPEKEGWSTDRVFWRLLPHLIGWIPYMAAWSILLTNFFGLLEAQGTAPNRVPGFVYAIVFGTFVIFSAFSVVQIYGQCMDPKFYYKTELYYCALSLTAKLFLGGIVYFSVLQQSSVDEALRG